MRKNLTVFLCLSASISSYSQADSTKGTFGLLGYMDSYCFLNTNNPKSGLNTGRSGFARAFEQKEEQIKIGLVQTKILYVQGRSDAEVDLTFGSNADLGNYGNVIGALGATKATSVIAIKQAFYRVKLTDKFSLMAGQFGTHIGYEVIDAPLNYHYSLSNLFNNGPFYHIGFRAMYQFNDQYGIMGGVVNNWDNLYDNNKYKTFIGQFSAKPKEGLSLYLNYIGGDETAAPLVNTDTTRGFKQMLNLVMTWQITPAFHLGINASQGIYSADKTKSYWVGAAVYTDIKFNDKAGVGLRAELFDNTQGVQYIGATDVFSITLTPKFSFIHDHWLVKPELRYDQYKKENYTGPDELNYQQFMDSKGNYTKNTQLTIGLAT